MAVCTEGIGAAPRKAKQRSTKSLQTLKIYFKQGWGNQTQIFFILFIILLWSVSFFFLSFLLSLFLLTNHNSKDIQCMQILNIPNDCSANLLHSYLLLSFMWATTGELWPWNCPWTPLCWLFLHTLSNNAAGDILHPIPIRTVLHPSIW